ncbi:MAG TPA: alanine dehydrogenase [Saprospiraceae bacterium]|nr:alanine dehydrogenase [Saprospiraceae bacterium]HUN17648.1 alanine dehydrogenase [Saprospiraceae bacterium]
MKEQFYFAEKSQLLTQAQLLAFEHAKSSLKIGIPKETTMQENRVALVPHSVINLTARGHEIVIESEAGLKSNYSDHEYSEAGAQIVHDKKSVFECDIILKVAPPTQEELEYFRPNQILISPLQLPTITSDYIQMLRQRRVTSLAMEYMQADDNSFPIVRTMSEIAGLAVIHTAAELLSDSKNGKGILLGGISGVPPAKVVILGAGVVAEYATRAALALGAEVRIFDDKIHRLIRIQNRIGRQLYTSAFNPVTILQQLMSADVVIGAMHSKTGRTPIIVTEEMVMKMKSGSVIIDVSVDQGGCIETSEVTSHEKPTRVVHGVVHYGVPNIASKVSRTASIGISNIITTFLQQAGDSGSIEKIIYDYKGLRNGIYTYKGCLTNEYLAQRFGIKYTNLDLLLTSGI